MWAFIHLATKGRWGGRTKRYPTAPSVVCPLLSPKHYYYYVGSSSNNSPLSLSSVSATTTTTTRSSERKPEWVRESGARALWIRLQASSPQRGGRDTSQGGTLTPLTTTPFLPTGDCGSNCRWPSRSPLIAHGRGSHDLFLTQLGHALGGDRRR